MDLAAIEQFLSGFTHSLTAPELHGVVTGFLSRGGSSAPQRLQVYSDWFARTVTDKEASVLEALYTEIEESLDEYADFEFRLLIPGDETTVDVRATAISQWCVGYLTGLGEISKQSGVSDETRELLADVASIAGIQEAVPEGEENERDLMEIQEYIRIAVLSIYVEFAGR